MYDNVSARSWIAQRLNGDLHLCAGLIPVTWSIENVLAKRSLKIAIVTTSCKLWLWGCCTVASQLDCAVAVVTGAFEHGLGLADGTTGEAILLVCKTVLGDLKPVTSLIPAGGHLNFL
jgi:hypothetical protein